jgi:hypothetical protein
MENAIALKTLDLTPVVRRMTDKEARECVAKINSKMNNVRSLIFDLYEREGWSAMGYGSWRECVVAEFKQGQSYLYRQLEAAQLEKIISPVGENEIPERQLRPFTKLKDPDLQRAAWQKAIEIAPEGKVTASLVKKAVNSVIGPKQNNQAIIKKAVKVQDIKAGVAEVAEFYEEEQTDFPTDAMACADAVISQLEHISADDPTREEALAKVETWIEEHRKGDDVGW